MNHKGWLGSWYLQLQVLSIWRGMRNRHRDRRGLGHIDSMEIVYYPRSPLLSDHAVARLDYRKRTGESESCCLFSSKYPALNEVVMAEGTTDTSNAGTHQRRFAFVFPAGRKERNVEEEGSLRVLPHEVAINRDRYFCSCSVHAGWGDVRPRFRPYD